jgi:hypothetical protein
MNCAYQTFVKSCMEPTPPIIPLLTMIRLTEDVVNETQRRGCAPLETVLFTLRLQMWPAFQKVMSEHVEQLKKYTDGVSGSGSVGGFFSRGVSTSDASVATVSIQCRGPTSSSSNTESIRSAIDM